MWRNSIVRGSEESVPDELGTPAGVAGAWLETAAFVLLLATLIVAPIPYGAVLPGGMAMIEILAFAAAAAAIASPRSRLRGAAIPVAALLLIALLGALQLLPLSEGLIHRISPASAKVYDDTNRVLRLFDRAPVAPRISIAPGETRDTILLTLAYAALLGTAAAVCSTRFRRRMVAGVLLGAGAVHVLIAAASSGGTERIHGAFVNADHFAGYLEIGAAFAFGWIWTEVLTGRDRTQGIRDRAERLERRAIPFVWRVLLWGVIAAGIVLTRSRGGLAAATIALAVMVAIGILHGPIATRRRAAVTTAAAITAGILFVALTTGQAAILRFLASDPRDIGTDTRVELWRSSIQAWHFYPNFGSGLGTFREAFRRVQPSSISGLVEQAHNDLLQLLVTGGWIGAILGAIVFVSLFALLLGGWVREMHREERAMMLAGFGALLSLTLHGVVDFNMSIPAIPATLAILLGTACASRSSST